MRRVFPIIVLLLVGAGMYFGLSRGGASAKQRAGLVQASGVVEGDRGVIAARSTGRITEMLFGKGETVVRGQVVARLADVRASERVSKAHRTLAALESKLRSEQAELAILQTKVPLVIKAGEANVNLTHAVLLQCENAEDAHRQEVERLRAIEDPDDEEKRQLDEAELAHENAERDVIVAQAAVERAESDLELARAGEVEIATRIEEVEALRTDRDNADAALAAMQNTVTSMTVVSPGEGIIAERGAAVGDEAEPGTALYEIVGSDAVYVGVELTDKELQGVMPGQEARIYLESDPEQPLDARVTGVFPSGAASGGWSVRLMPAAPTGRRMVLGMRANVTIRVRDDAKWVAPKLR